MHTLLRKTNFPSIPSVQHHQPHPTPQPTNQPPPNPNTSPYQTYSSPNPTPNPTIPPSPARPHNLISAVWTLPPSTLTPSDKISLIFTVALNLNPRYNLPGNCFPGVRENDVDLIGILYLFDVRSIYALLLEEIAVFKISTLNLQQMRYARDIKSTGREVGSRAEKG
jgi:hypothetical protein